MTSPIIQLPFLRPDPVHEFEGTIGGIGQSLSGLAQLLTHKQAMDQQLLMHRGQLAIEQSKLDFEKSQAAERRKQVEAGIAAIDQMHGIPQKPSKQGQGQVQAGQQPGAPSQPQEQAQSTPQPQQQGGIGDIATAFPQIAAELLRQQQDAQKGQQLGSILSQYKGTELRNDPNKRMEALGQMMRVDPAMAEQWSRTNPARQTIVRFGTNGAMRVDGQTGEILGFTALNKSLGLLQGRFQAFGPQYKQSVNQMYAIEKADPGAAQQVATALIGSGIKFADIGNFTSAIAKAGFSGNAAKYSAYLRAAVEASIGLQPAARAGKDFQTLVQDVIMPGPAEIANRSGELETRQQVRLMRLQGFEESIKDQMFQGMSGQTTEQPKDSLDAIGNAIGKLGIKVPS